jgi:hypothetical protein
MDKSCVTMHNVLVNQSWETWPNGRTTPAGSNGTLQHNSCISIMHGAEQRGESERWSVNTLSSSLTYILGNHIICVMQLLDL